MKIKGFLHTIELSLTNHCTLQCVGCNSLSKSSSLANEMVFSKVLKIIKNFEIREIVICGNGGEPLEHGIIYQVLKDLIEHFPEAIIRVATNGEKIIELFSAEDLAFLNKKVIFEVAVDGHTNEVHQLTRKKGSLEKVLSSVQFLVDTKSVFRLICTRHLSNESELENTYKFLKQKFNMELNFRDTTIISASIRPPSHISSKGDVSILYNTELPKVLDYIPNSRNLYIEHDGQCYPCVSFHKFKTNERPVNIYDFDDTVSFLKSFKIFQTIFCDKFQKDGDIRQCQLNCGIYQNNFRYDSIEDLRQHHD